MLPANSSPARRGLIPYKRRRAAGASAAEEPGATSAPARRGLIPCKRRRTAGASAAEEPGANSAPARRGLILCERSRAAGASAAEEPGASAVEEPSTSSPPWASLQEDMLHLVALCLLAGDNGIADYLCFRAVCARWRSSTACPRGRGVVDPRFHPRHWMMLPEGYGLRPGHPQLGGWVRFINLRTGSIARIHLPLFNDHFVLDSVDGLLLVQYRNRDMAVRLLHPFTGDIVHLPSLATILPQLTERPNPRDLTYLVQGVSATAVSVRPDGVITAMLAFDPYLVKHIAFATSEDQQWTLSSWQTDYRATALSLQGKLYFLVHRLPSSKVFMVDPPLQQRIDRGSSATSSSLQPPMLIATFPQQALNVTSPLHLVERNSEILLVGHGPSLLHFLIYRLADVIVGRFVPLKCIGDSSLFLSLERNICVSSKIHPAIAGDSVISLNPSTGCLGKYLLKSGTWSTTDGRITRGPIPSPYTLVHHIFTCCMRRFWNKGRIYCNGAYESTSRGAKKKRRRGT